MIYTFTEAIDCGLILNDESRIEEVIDALEKSGKGFVVLIDKIQGLAGVITDGDLRRHSLSKNYRFLTARDICTTKPISIHHVDMKLAEKLCDDKGVKFLPVLCDERVVEIFCKDINNTTRVNAGVFIMAGGRGTRLMPYTKNCPKPLVHVQGVPIILRIINQFKREGFEKFYISVKYLSHMIIDLLGDGSNFGVSIEYIEESSPLGTAGSLSLLSYLECDYLIVTNGDVLTGISFEELYKNHLNNKNDLTIYAKSFELQNPYGVIESKNGIVTSLTEKPVYKSKINTGVYCLSKGILKYLDKNRRCDMTQLIEKIISENKKVGVFESDHYWIDLGTESDLKRAHTDYYFE